MLHGEWGHPFYVSTERITSIEHATPQRTRCKAAVFCGESEARVAMESPDEIMKMVRDATLAEPGEWRLEALAIVLGNIADQLTKGSKT